jgi:Zn-dependent peptidase ImmA (M78 family)
VDQRVFGLDKRNAGNMMSHENWLKAEMERQARRLLDKYQRSYPPYDPLAIAEALGVEVIETNLPGLEGCVELKDGRYVAQVSCDSVETRKRFTVAHELGHVLLMREAAEGKPVNLVRYRTNGCPPGLHQDPVEESICNRFASELLLPSDEVKRKLFEGKEGRRASMPDARLIRVLASRYNVSSMVAAGQVVRALGHTRAACSLWSLDTPWPMPHWWIGIKTKDKADLKALEALAKDRAKAEEVWPTFNGKRQSVRIKVSPHLDMKATTILITHYRY